MCMSADLSPVPLHDDSLSLSIYVTRSASRTDPSSGIHASSTASGPYGPLPTARDRKLRHSTLMSSAKLRYCSTASLYFARSTSWSGMMSVSRPRGQQPGHTIGSSHTVIYRLSAQSAGRLHSRATPIKRLILRTSSVKAGRLKYPPASYCSARAMTPASRSSVIATTTTIPMMIGIFPSSAGSVSPKSLMRM